MMKECYSQMNISLVSITSLSQRISNTYEVVMVGVVKVSLWLYDIDEQVELNRWEKLIGD